MNLLLHGLFVNRLGRIVLRASPLIAAAPFLLWSDRYSSTSRYAYLLVLCVLNASLILWVEKQPAARLQGSPAKYFAVIAAVYILVVLGVVYGLRFSRFALSAGLAAGDTAIFEQALWNTIHGNGILVSTLEGGSHLAVHNSPFLLLLALGYALLPNTLYLFATQTLAVLGSGWLLFKIAEPRLPSLCGVLLATAFLVHPLTLANQFFFHETFFAGLFFLLAVYFILGRHWVKTLVAILLLLSVYERSALLVLGLCVVMWFTQAPRRWILLAFAVTLLNLVSTPLVLNAFRTPETLAFSFYYFRHLGSTPGEIISTAIGNPALLARPLLDEGGAKMLLVYGLISPLFFFLPFGSVWILPILTESVFNLLASDLNGLSWHYATILTGLFFGTVMTVGRWFSADPLRRAPWTLALSIAILANTLALMPVTINPEALAVNSTETAQMQKAVNIIPAIGALCADSNLIQYFARRAVLYSNQTNPAEWLARCDYVILDRRNREWNQEILQALATDPGVAQRQFEIVLAEERVLVLRKRE